MMFPIMAYACLFILMLGVPVAHSGTSRTFEIWFYFMVTLIFATFIVGIVDTA